jgi:pimeloyl-ACP methyl ester carboxylesterase
VPDENGTRYGGMVITGVAEHARDRIAHLVYVDALVPEHGQSAMDVLPEPTRNTFRKLADEGGGWRMRPGDHLLDLWGLEDGPARAFVQERLADFTVRCFSQPLEAPTHAAHKLPRSYIASVKPGYPAKAVFDPFAARARREGWSYHELPTGHDARLRCQRLSASCCSRLRRLIGDIFPAGDVLVDQPEPRSGEGGPPLLTQQSVANRPAP